MKSKEDFQKDRQDTIEELKKLRPHPSHDTITGTMSLSYLQSIMEVFIDIRDILDKMLSQIKER